jgi:hypothetical protein
VQQPLAQLHQHRYGTARLYCLALSLISRSQVAIQRQHLSNRRGLRCAVLSSIGRLHRNDFVLAMLLRLGRVSKVDLLRTEQIFFNLDKDHSGMIDKEDLKNLLATQRRRLQKARQESMLGTKHPVMPRHFTPKGHFLHVGGPTFDSEEKMAEHSGENLSSEIKAVHAPVQSSL